MFCYINIIIIMNIIIAIYLWITSILQHIYFKTQKNKNVAHIYCYIDIHIFKTIKQQLLYSYILYILH